MSKKRFLRFRIALEDIHEDEKFNRLLPKLEDFLINNDVINYTVGFDNENVCIIQGEFKSSTKSMCNAQFKLFKEKVKEFFYTKHINEILVATGDYLF